MTASVHVAEYKGAVQLEILAANQGIQHRARHAPELTFDTPIPSAFNLEVSSHQESSCEVLLTQLCFDHADVTTTSGVDTGSTTSPLRGKTPSREKVDLDSGNSTGPLFFQDGGGYSVPGRSARRLRDFT